MVSREELAWCAGFLDGEGSFTFRSKKGPWGEGVGVFRISAGQTDRGPLDRLVRSLGGKIYGPYNWATNRKPMYSWDCTNFEDSQNVVCLLWEFLCEPKRIQAFSALLQYYGSKENKPQKPVCNRGHDYSDCYINPKTGHRRCRECSRIAAKERRQNAI